LKNRIYGLSLRVAAGEILGLTGLLGAGQNEIARVLGGDIAPDNGSIMVLGEPVALRDPSDGVAAGVCLVTDDRKTEGILPSLSLRHNVALPSLRNRALAGTVINATAERNAVTEQIRLFGVIAASINSPMWALSGGNQQKALIARWNLDNATVFILIEPTRGVDVAARLEIYRRIVAIAATRKAVIVVSFDIPELLAITDRILVFREGRVVAETQAVDTDEESLNLLIQGAQ
jgi:ABC-type sugar transport system ATPase subunit